MFTNSNIILPQTLLLLEQLMEDNYLQQFYLVGGTSLALQIGHRFSIDLDLFSNEPFNNETLQTYLEEKYFFETDFVANNTLKGSVKGVKLDFITHAYSLIEPFMIVGNIRLASLKDIAAMKLNAIAHNGTRYKDFIDIYFLLKTFCLNEMLESFSLKYPKANPIIALKGLGYFEEINFEFDKPVLTNLLIFNNLKKRLLLSIAQPAKVF